MDIRSAFLNHQQTCLQVLPSNLLGKLLFGDHLIFSWQHLNVTSPRRKKLGTLLKNAKHIPINIQSLVTSFFGGTLLGEDGNFELQFEEGTEQNMGSDKKTNLIRTVWNFLRKHEKKLSFFLRHYQPKQCTNKREIPRNYNTFTLFDPPKLGNLVTLFVATIKLKSIHEYRSRTKQLPSTRALTKKNWKKTFTFNPVIEHRPEQKPIQNIIEFMSRRL